MNVVLQTERMMLRCFTAEDADHLVELDSDPAVMRYINGGKPPPREEVVGKVLPRFLGYYDRYAGYGFWAAVEKSTGEFLGWFHLRPAEGGRQDEPVLGYRLKRSAWGRGYATEGSLALEAKAFTELGAQRVWASTMTVNLGSRRVMEKVGLNYVRTFFQSWPEVIEGSEHGDVEYEITQEDWEKRRGAS